MYYKNQIRNHKGISTTLLMYFLSLAINSNAAIRTSTANGGIWTVGTTWIGGVAPVSGDDAIIATTGGGSVTLGGASSIANFTINVGSIFNDGNHNLTVSGNLVINGSYNGSGTGQLKWTGNAKTIDGTGTINNVNRLDLNNSTTKTILASADITFTGTNQHIDFGSQNTLTNNGTITVKNITGSSTSEWINEANATINISEALLTTGTLTATATGNSVNYNGSSAQTIKPTSYYHLTYSGTNTGTVGGNINVAGDLTVGSGIWSASTYTSTFNGIVGQNIYGAAPITFYNLTLDNTSSNIPQFIFNIGVTTQKTLNMTSGIVNLDGNLFTLGENGIASMLTRAASLATNWMYGGIFKRFWLTATTISSTSGNFYGLFPTGTMNLNSYRPVELNSTGNITSSGFFTVNHIDAIGTIDLDPAFNDAGTNITRIHKAQFITAISGVTAGIFRISATMTGLPTGNLSDIRLAIFTGGTTSSVVGNHSAAIGTSPNPTAIRTVITNIANLNNDFRIATTNIAATPIPIKLVVFSGEVVANDVVLRWITASEFNNGYFNLERSLDGKDWAIIGTVAGAGNSFALIKYSFVDADRYKGGVSYYRLKQTDFDGNYCYSKTIVVDFEKTFDISVYPNPFSEMVTIAISNESLITKVDQTAFGLRIYNILGEEMINKAIAGQVTILEMSLLPKGIYFYKIFLNDLDGEISPDKTIGSGKLISQ